MSFMTKVYNVIKAAERSWM